MTLQRRVLSSVTQYFPAAALAGFVYWMLTAQGDNRKWMSATATALITAGAASAVNLLVGYTGILTLGHATFLVVGGYAGAVWAVDLGLDPWLGFPAAFIFGALVGVILAVLSAHLRGFYLTVVTLSLGLLMPALMRIFEGVFGGPQGRRVAYPSLDVMNLPLAEHSRQRGLVVVAAGVLFVVLFVVRNLVNSRWGRAWMAIRDSEIAARASGVNTYWYKVAVFGVSSGLVAMVGVVAAIQFRIVSNEIGPQALSFRLVVICVLGGLGTIAGPVIASIGISFVLATTFVQDTFGEYLGIFFGVLAILGIIGNPGGQAEVLTRIVRKLRLAPVGGSGDGDLQSGRGAGRTGTVLELCGLTKRFGGILAVDTMNLSVEAGTIHGLIGPNGSGKTTLINLVSGFYKASGGEVRLCGNPIEHLGTDRRVRLGLARTFQNVQIWRGMTVLANVQVGGHHHTHTDLFRSILGLDFLEERRLRRQTWALLRFVGLEEKAHHLAGSLPFADQRRLEIARALAADPVVLLLDEPGAGLHPAEQRDLVRLVREIKDRGVTVLLIEHHMNVVMGLSDKVTVIDYGRTIAEGTPEQVQADPAVIQAYLGHGTDAVSARPRTIVEEAPEAALLRVEDLEVTYGAARALQGISFEVHEGEVVAIIGGNGAGKTTTLKTISGLAESLKSVHGRIWFEGRHIERKPAHAIARAGIVHVPEGRRVFPAMTVEENLVLGGYRRRRGANLSADVHEVFKRFEILGKRRDQAAGLLSGGEQQMLAMGRALMAHPKLLLLDEPSLGLAPKIVEEIFEIIEGLARDGTTIILVEQLASQALAISDRAYVLEGGMVTLGGPSEDLRRDPAVVAAYLGA